MGFVKQHGSLLMTLKDGEVIFPVLENATPPVSLAAETGDLDQEE